MRFYSHWCHWWAVERSWKKRKEEEENQMGRSAGRGVFKILVVFVMILRFRWKSLGLNTRRDLRFSYLLVDDWFIACMLSQLISSSAVFYSSRTRRMCKSCREVSFCSEVDRKSLS